VAAKVAQTSASVNKGSRVKRRPPREASNSAAPPRTTRPGAGITGWPARRARKRRDLSVADKAWSENSRCHAISGQPGFDTVQARIVTDQLGCKTFPCGFRDCAPADLERRGRRRVGELFVSSCPPGPTLVARLRRLLTMRETPA
jgi:hypothetical protein